VKWELSGRKRAKADTEATPEVAQAPEPVQSTDVEIDRFLALKTAIHRKLLDRINLSILDKLSREQIEEEVGDIVLELLVEEDAALNARERVRLVGEVLDELLGPRAA
jgi:pilus assembly protein CpaF